MPNELMFSRAIILNTYVRHSWRKSTVPRIQSVDSTVIMEEPDFTGVAIVDLIEQAANGFSVVDS